MPNPGQLAMLISPQGLRRLIFIEPDRTLHTGDGMLKTNDFIAARYGDTINTHIGVGYKIYKPTLYDVIKNIKRQTQILYPKEIGYILVKLGIGPGSRVIEAGSGSGSMTISLAWHVGDEGKVYTYDRREEFVKLCGENLALVGLNSRVEQFHADAAHGFFQEDADAVFLDAREPWECLDAAYRALLPGAPIAFLLPTVNQVSDLLRALENTQFSEIEVLEIMLRRYKPVADRLRPEDRMVAHTGYLVFARKY